MANPLKPNQKYVVWCLASDGALEVGKLNPEPNRPTEDELSVKTKALSNGDITEDYYIAVAENDQKYYDWCAKLGGAFARDHGTQVMKANPQSYVLGRLPHNYTLYEHVKITRGPKVEGQEEGPVRERRSDLYLYGNVGGRKKRYRSPNEFFNHLVFLMTHEEKQLNWIYCSCKFCAPPQDVQLMANGVARRMAVEAEHGPGSATNVAVNAPALQMKRARATGGATSAATTAAIPATTARASPIAAAVAPAARVAAPARPAAMPSVPVTAKPAIVKPTAAKPTAARSTTAKPIAPAAARKNAPAAARAGQAATNTMPPPATRSVPAAVAQPRAPQQQQQQQQQNTTTAPAFPTPELSAWLSSRSNELRRLMQTIADPNEPPKSRRDLTEALIRELDNLVAQGVAIPGYARRPPDLQSGMTQA